VPARALPALLALPGVVAIAVPAWMAAGVLSAVGRPVGRDPCRFSDRCIPFTSGLRRSTMRLAHARRRVAGISRARAALARV